MEKDYVIEESPGLGFKAKRSPDALVRATDFFVVSAGVVLISSMQISLLWVSLALNANMCDANKRLAKKYYTFTKYVIISLYCFLSIHLHIHNTIPLLIPIDTPL